jgi:hypothetical protein
MSVRMSPRHFCFALLSSALLGASASAANVPLPAGCEPAGAGVAAAAAPAPSAFPPVQLQVRTPLEPAVLPGAGRNYLVYELHLQNYAADAMTLRGIQVFDAGKPGAGPIADIKEAQLDASLRRVTIGENAGGNRNLGTGQGAVAFLCLAFDGHGARAGQAAPPRAARWRYRGWPCDRHSRDAASCFGGTGRRNQLEPGQ